MVVMLASVMISKPTGLNQLKPYGSMIGKKMYEGGTTKYIGHYLFTDYIFPFEAVSLLLLAALIGAVVLAKRHVNEVES